MKSLIWILLLFTVILTKTDDFESSDLPEIIPLQNDYSGLKKFIGNAQYVVLGEQDHGDGSTIALKVDIVKYLVEEMGFSVVMFESDFYSLLFQNDKGKPESIQAVWTNCGQFNSFIKYYNQKLNTANPLKIYGFDSHATEFSASTLEKELKRKLAELGDLTFLGDTSYWDMSGTLFKYRRPAGLKIEEIEYLINQNLSIYKFFKLKDEQSYSIITGNLVSNCILWSKILQSDTLSGYKYRDSVMSTNILWLAENIIKDEKAIIWTADFHGAKDSVKVYSSNVNFRPMASYLSTLSLKSIGFITLSGQTKRFNLDSATRITHTENSLEFQLSHIKSEPVLLNFNSCYNRNSTFIMGVIGHAEMSDRWMRLFDGVIYYKELKPCE